MELRKLLTGMLICVCLWRYADAMPVALAQEGIEEEALLKAAFIYNFAKFTRWPAEGRVGQGAPLSLCIAGEDDLADALVRLAGRKVRGRQISIHRFKDGRVPVGCQMLYVAASEQNRYLDLIKSTSGQPVLTISELPGFAPSGGSIEIYRDYERIRFIINLRSARGAGLEISPNLLKLALVLDQE